ncbi:EGF-like domain protein [Trichuris suis]|nr:EGF-like domain protein [Trichuris suis]
MKIMVVGRAVVLLPFLACTLSLCPSDFNFPGFFDSQDHRCLTVVPTDLIVVPWKGDWIGQANAICSNLFYRGSLARRRFPVSLIDPEWSMLRKREPITLLDGCEISLKNGSDVSIFGNDLYRACPDAIVRQFMQSAYSSGNVRLGESRLKDPRSQNGQEKGLPLICAYQSVGYSFLMPLFFRCDDKEFKIQLVTCEHSELNFTCSGWDDALGVCYPCLPGYTGRFCGSPIEFHGKSKRRVIDIHTYRHTRPDCSHMCPVRSSCVPTSNGTRTTYMCKCHWAYVGNMCQKKWSMCHLEKRCSINAVCVDVPNYYAPYITYRTFQCVCKVGWAGPYCEKNVDECRRRPCRNGYCSNTYGGFKCICYAGYTGNLCDQDVNECASNPCKYGICRDLFNSYSCDCHIGFTGRHCEIDINECESQPCRNGGTCIDGYGQWSCECPPMVHGRQCQNDERPCSVNHCKTGGTCIDRGLDFECLCPPGRTGKTCEQDVNECISKPCKNGGHCINGDNKYTCNCIMGFTGINCDIDVDECAINDCGPHGTCENLPGGFVCNCEYGYEGEMCDKDINECIPNPCQHNGICIDSVGEYICKCSDEFTGKDCEIAIIPCTDGVCMFGQCAPGVPVFTCHCDQGFTGERCDVRIDHCEGVSCGPNAYCVATFQTYSCQCNLGFTGKNCEQTHSGACDTPNVCHNGGTCTNELGMFKCHCLPKFTGSFCDIETIKEKGKTERTPSKYSVATAVKPVWIVGSEGTPRRLAAFLLPLKAADRVCGR